MPEPDFLSSAMNCLLRTGASAEALARFRRTYSAGRTAYEASHRYPCPVCFVSGNDSAFMSVVSKLPTTELLRCESCGHEANVSSGSSAD
jgi:hypothetical protein